MAACPPYPAVRLIGLVVVLSGVLVGWWMDRWRGALVVGALAFGLVGGTRDAPAHADLRLRGRATALGSKLAGELALFLGAGLVYGLVVKLPGGLAFGLGLGLVVGLLTGLIDFATNPSIARRASSPAESQRGDRRLTVLVTGTLWLMVVLVVVLAYGVAWLAVGLGWHGSWWAGRLLNGLAAGLVFGLVFLPAASKTCWPGFVVASLWLGVLRRLPLRLMGFLDDAYRLGLLRVVGPVYQFRHAALQDHLAPSTRAIGDPGRTAQDVITLSSGDEG